MRLFRSIAPHRVGRRRRRAAIVGAVGVAFASVAIAPVAWPEVSGPPVTPRSSTLGVTLPIAGSVGAGTTHYVSCRTGDDHSSGMRTTDALATVAAVNRLALVAGDRVLFERGCRWTETLTARWSGTPTAPIVLGAYGTGPAPMFTNTRAQAADGYRLSIVVSGQHQVVDGLETTLTDPPRSPCGGNPIGWFTGIAVTPGATAGETADDNVLRGVTASNYTAGIHITFGADRNVVEHSTLTGNGTMSILTDDGPGVDPDNGDDIGAWGILLHGSSNQIRHNHFESNVAVCGYDTMPQGNAVEIYEGADNVISHNVSVDDQTFSELGSSERQVASGNRYLYNEVRSDVPDPDFIVVRGFEDAWGPNPGTVVANNTVYYTGKDSSGVACFATCGPDILTMENNVLWVEWKALFFDQPFTESNNLFWNSRGEPFVQALAGALSPTSVFADPQFVSTDLGRLDLGLDSPAIDSGGRRYHDVDVARRPIAGSDRPDLGAHESDPARVSRWRTTGVDLIDPHSAVPPVSDD